MLSVLQQHSSKMIRNIGFLIITFLLSIMPNAKGFSQISIGGGNQEQGMINPIESWDVSFKSTGNCKGDIIIEGKLKEGWHFYSQNTEAGMPAYFEFNSESKIIQFIDQPQEGKTVTHYSDVFQANETIFEKDILFKQKVSFTEANNVSVSILLEGQACIEDGSCVPVDFEKTIQITADQIKCSDQKVVVIPVDKKIEEDSHVETISEKDSSEHTEVEKEKHAEEIPNKVDIAKEDKKESEDKSLIGIFIAGFLGGLLALLTPCVFPMIPMTVSFFTKSEKSGGVKGALTYAFFIIAIYVGLGLIVTASFGSEALNEMASNSIFNFIFFLVFFIFALSFLGAFEITLPNSWINKADKASDKGGLIGIFFMALVLSLVSFSCTGPIIGTLLVEAAVMGSYTGPAIGMFGFSLALALPFALFAIFPSWINNLPKSGGWLNSVKVVLGIVELALAFKFLSVVDMINHWDFLTREVFLAIWIVLSITLAAYLFGFIKFSHDSDVVHISIPRYLLGTSALIFAIYMLPGMFGAPVKLLSGLAPPRHYSEDAFRFMTGTPVTNNTDENFDFYLGPHGLQILKDVDQAKKYAKKVNKPILLDFTGHSCVNCRKMEDNVWGEEKILKLLNKYVIVSLYVDERDELDERDWYTSKFSGKKIKTIGKKWHDFQATNFGTNSQPYYVPYSSNGEELIAPKGYTPEVEDYYKFLKSGLDAFNQRNNK